MAQSGAAQSWNQLKTSVTLDEIRRFRQIGSKTPGHPEYHWVSVETTTGPLGQGVATSVGMAIARKRLANQRSIVLKPENKIAT
jgi:transketolase